MDTTNISGKRQHLSLRRSCVCQIDWTQRWKKNQTHVIFNTLLYYTKFLFYCFQIYLISRSMSACSTKPFALGLYRKRPERKQRIRASVVHFDQFFCSSNISPSTHIIMKIIIKIDESFLLQSKLMIIMCCMCFHYYWVNFNSLNNKKLFYFNMEEDWNKRHYLLFVCYKNKRRN